MEEGFQRYWTKHTWFQTITNLDRTLSTLAAINVQQSRQCQQGSNIHLDILKKKDTERNWDIQKECKIESPGDKSEGQKLVRLKGTKGEKGKGLTAQRLRGFEELSEAKWLMHWVQKDQV